MARNRVLESAIGDILGQPMPVLSNIDVEFVNDSDTGSFSFVPFAIDHAEFDFDYTGNSFTSILMNIKVSGRDYALLQDQSQNLLASVKITPLASDGTKIRTVAPYMKQFRVMLVNSVDTRISMSDIHLYTDPDRNMIVRLVDPLTYRLRHETITTQIQKASVSDMVHYLAHCYDISKIDIIAPDNTHVYDQMLIPSYPSFTSVFGYLQSTYGVYGKGCCAYIQDDRLYVYPPFETNPETGGTLTLYQSRVGQASLGGSKYSRAGDDYRIIIDKPAHTTDLSLAGAENHGTGFSFVRASRITDGTTYIDAHKDGAFTSDNTLIANVVSPQTLDPSANRIKHIKTTDNPYPQMSLIAAHNAAIMTAEWEGADIQAFTPGKRIVYCYDEQGTMARRSGILDQARLTYVKQQRVGNKNAFSCHGTLTLRLTPAPRRSI